MINIHLYHLRSKLTEIEDLECLGIPNLSKRITNQKAFKQFMQWLKEGRTNNETLEYPQ